MRTIVRLTGPPETKEQWGISFREYTRYEWDLPDSVPVKALTQLRAELATYAKSGKAEPLHTGREILEDSDEEVILVRMVMKEHVGKGTLVMINTAVRKALDG